MKPSNAEPRKLRRLKPRGQAMVEYSIVAHFILFSGTLLLLPVITKMFEALTAFYDSVYSIIQTAAL
ncbi:MAG: hypothetical protein AMXMBFR34_19070 [Myxococcaceae bacterium]